MAGFSSDIISEVVAAADPRRAEAARQRLSASAAAATSDFASLLRTAPAREVSFRAPTSPASHRTPKRPAAGESPMALAYRSLGAVLLQKAFEAMTPASGSDGASRSAASMWKSMLAQQLADSVSARMFKLPNALAEAGRPDSSGDAPAATGERAS